MSEEDIRYRQGRSRKQVEGTYVSAYVSFLGGILMLIGMIIGNII